VPNIPPPIEPPDASVTPGGLSDREPAPPPPLGSVHTPNFADILDRSGSALLVTTYQAGKLVVVRADRGRLNTHFRSLRRPMGLAAADDRLAVGTAGEVWEFRDHPDAGRRLEPDGKLDACYLPRVGHVTGDILIHEMAWAGHELWFVNTRFSCLCTLSPSHSFVPRWRPPFISALVPEDRCHLNGLGLRDGRVRYATALGRSDQADGWRAARRDGGILLDVTTDRILLSGLAMPHSPRWYAGRLWLLESGTGRLGYLDPSSERYRAVALLPGFTRGLDFAGPLAFVGLSQVRESSVFGASPIAERPVAERACGVWVVDIRTGQTVALLKFEDAVQEVFAVQVLPGRRFPDLLTGDHPLLARSFVLPDLSADGVPMAGGPPRPG
jgi:uncharacterized protein (TIGR03032 family)